MKNKTLRTYKIKNRPVKFVKPVKKDITEYEKQELFLIVANTEKYYILRNDIKLLVVLSVRTCGCHNILFYKYDVKDSSLI